MLNRAMKRLNGLAQARILAAAQARCEGAKARVPVDTGRLRRSIHVEMDGLTAKVVTDCEYAAAVELGTRFSPPQPFMRE